MCVSYDLAPAGTKRAALSAPELQAAEPAAPKQQKVDRQASILKAIIKKPSAAAAVAAAASAPAPAAASSDNAALLCGFERALLLLQFVSGLGAFS